MHSQPYIEDDLDMVLHQWAPHQTYIQLGITKLSTLFSARNQILQTRPKHWPDVGGQRPVASLERLQWRGLEIECEMSSSC